MITHLRRIGIQNTIHRILREPRRAREAQHSSLVRARGEQEQENPRQQRADRHAQLPASQAELGLALHGSGLGLLSVAALQRTTSFFLVHHILPSPRPVDDEAGEDGAGDADDGDDSVVPVGGVRGGVRVDALGEVEREEGVVEWVCEADETEG